MLVGITRCESVNASQGRKKQGRKAAYKCLRAGRQQRKGVVGLGAFMGLYRRLESGHNRSKCLLRVEPMCEEMHANTRQTGRDRYERSPGAKRRTAFGVARATLGPIELPEAPEPLKLADAQRYGCPSLGDLVEQDPARALRVIVKPSPQPGLRNVAKLASSIKG
jgi:hypothetical protein